MNSKGHLVVSLIKSIVRIGSCLVAIACHRFDFGLWGIACAEILGIVEELVDKRG